MFCILSVINSFTAKRNKKQLNIFLVCRLYNFRRVFYDFVIQFDVIIGEFYLKLHWYIFHYEYKFISSFSSFIIFTTFLIYIYFREMNRDNHVYREILKHLYLFE